MIRVAVDPTNPGQFFACCGLLELADRLWPGAEGWFAEKGREFCIDCKGTLRDLLQAAKSVMIEGINTDDEEEDEQDEDDDDAKGIVIPVQIISPVKITIDWWADKSMKIKTWAGSMNVHRIAIAMARAIDPDRLDPFSQCEIIYNPPKQILTKGKLKTQKLKKREPFYFDSVRGPNAHARDVGFSPNDLKLTTTASPVVEFLCLLGLQRCRPKLTSEPRIFQYFTWLMPVSTSILQAAINGLLPYTMITKYQFQNEFRSGKRDLKSFMPAIPLTGVSDE